MPMAMVMGTLTPLKRAVKGKLELLEAFVGGRRRGIAKGEAASGCLVNLYIGKKKAGSCGAPHEERLEG